MATLDDVQAMIALRRDEGWSLAQIGSHFGLSAERVRQILKEHNIDTSRIIRPPQDVPFRRSYDWDEIAYLHQEKQLSSYDIGLVIDGNPTYIRQILSKMGLLRSQSEASALKREQRQEDENVVAA